MLKETSRFANYGGPANRKMFTDSDMDLYIWFKSNEPKRFHLSYNKPFFEQAISWNNESGFEFDRFDAGEAITLMFGLQDNSFENEISAPQLALQFLHASEHIEPWLADFIYARLLEYPGRNAIHINQDRVLRSF